MMQSYFNSPNSLSERLLRRIVPALVLTIIIVTLLLIVNIGTNQVAALQITHGNAIDRASFNVSDKIQPIINSTLRSASDSRLQALLEGTINLVVAAQRTGDLITAYPDDVTAISLLDLEGEQILEVVNASGFPQLTAQARIDRRSVGEPETAFYEALDLDDSMAIGHFTIAVNLDNGQQLVPVRPSLSLYAPVRGQTNQLLGIYRVTLNPTNLFNILNRADTNFLDPLPGRRVIMTAVDDLVVADSNANSLAYIEQLDASSGNLRTSELYTQLGTYLTDSTARTVTAELSNNNLVTMRPILLDNVVNPLWRVFLVDPLLSAYSIGFAQTMVLIVGSIVLSLLATILLRRLINASLATVEQASTMVSEMARGENTLTTSASAPLIESVTRVAQQIADLNQNFEVQVRRRNRDLKVMGRIGYESAGLADLDALMKRSINLICNEMGFYHAQVFIIDPLENKVRLAYSRGEAGQEMLARRHALDIGSASVIGTVASERRIVVINDVDDPNNEFPHRFNPLLQETRAEMALPMIVNNELLGILDIQSVIKGVFQPDDLPIFELLGNQIGVAMVNSRLRSQAEQRVEQIDRLNRQLTRSAWEDMSSDLRLNEVYGTAPQAHEKSSAAITIRGEAIGTLEAALPDGQSLTEGDKIILQAVADRVAIAIENARLFQQTQLSLAETSTLYQLSQELNEAVSLEEIVRAVATTVAPDASDGQLWLFDDVSPTQKLTHARLHSDVPFQVRLQSSYDLVGESVPMPNFIASMSNVEARFVTHILTEDSIDEMLRSLLMSVSAVSLIAIPLNMRGVWKGFVTLYFNQGRTLGERERRIFDALIAQVGVAIDNRLLQQQTEDALNRNEKLYAASAFINTARELTDLIGAAVATSEDPKLDFWLGLLEGEMDKDGWRDKVRLVAISEHSEIIESSDVMALYAPQGSALKQGEPYLLTDDETISTSDRFMLHGHGLSFMAQFPLYIEGLPIGVFYIVSMEQKTLTDEDYEVYRALSSQMSVQIQNRRLLAQTESALNDATRLYVASRAISSVQDIQSLYNALTGHLGIPFVQNGTDRNELSITMLLARPRPAQDAPELEIAYRWSSLNTENVTLQRYAIIEHVNLPLATLIANSDDDVLVYNNLNILPDNNLKSLLRVDKANAAIIAPVQVRQLWFGALMIHAQHADLFTESYVRFVQAIADQVAVALENQNLLVEAQFERANLTNILATLPAGVLVLDPETFVPLQVNDRARELFGKGVNFTLPMDSQRYHLYKTGTAVFYPQDELPIFMSSRLSLPAFRDDITFQEGNRRVDLLVNAAPIFDNRGRKIAIVSAFQDITNLRTLENTLQDNLKETLMLYETQRALTEAETLEDLLDTIMMQLSMQQSSDVHIVLANENGDVLSLPRYLVNPIEDLEAIRPILQGDFLQVEDVPKAKNLDNACKAALSKAFIARVITAPLRAKTRALPLGWLVISENEAGIFSADQVRSLTTLSDMASTAIDNNYLVQSTQVALQETASLYAAATTINRSKDISELSLALSAALNAIQPDVYAGFLWQGDQLVTLFNEGFQELLDAVDLDNLVLSELEKGDSWLVEDVTQLPKGRLHDEIRKIEGISSLGIANLRVQETTGGRLFVAFRESHTFNDGDTRFLNTVSDSASVVIDNMVLLEQVQSTLQETSTLYQASRALTDATNASQILDVAVTHLIETHVSQVFIVILNRPRWNALAAAAHVMGVWSAEDEPTIIESAELTADNTPLWSLMSAEEVTAFNADELEAEQQEAMRTLGIETFMVVPLRVPNRAIGMLAFASNVPYTYNDREIRVLQSFGEQASLSLEAARLLEQTERRASQLEATAQISERVGQILDLDVLLPQVVNLIRERFNYDHVQVFLMDANDDYAILRASTGEAGEKLLSINHKLQKGSASVIGQVTANNRVTIASDTADAKVVHKPNQYLPKTRSEMALPLVVKGRVAGALDVQSNQRSAFGDEDVQTLSTLAAQISVAIDNARLYEDAQTRANELGFLFDITTAATAADTLENVLQSILQRIYDALNPLAVAFFLPQIYTDANKSERTILEAAAVVGGDLTLRTLPKVRVGDAENLLGIIGSTLQSQIVPNIDKEVRYQSLAQGARSAIAVPIGSGADLIGLIAMESSEFNAYTSDTLTLLLTLSGSLSAIIQNTLLVSELQSTNDQLREVDRLKSQFLANMSHELRTPLNSIIGFSRVMLKGIDGPLTEMQEQDLTTIYGSGNHLLNLINDILDQAKIEAKEMQLKQALFDVKPMIESVKSIAVGLLKDKPLQLYIEIAPNLPQAFADEFRTRQILLNLMSNAIKFTTQGSVTLRVYQMPFNDVNFIRVDVIDTGLGIDEKDMPILFEQFRQIDNSLTRTVGGTGLGLPISRSLAELQGGQLIVGSVVGEGSTFSVTIPTAPVETLTPKKRDTKPLDSSVYDTAVIKRENVTREMQAAPRMEIPPMPMKREVLLIEDSKEMVDMFRRTLQREGFEVQTADHPSYAEAMVGQLRPTMVLLDVNFANGTGWQMLENLKKRDDTADIPIIVTTLSPDRERVESLGANRFLQRPFMPDQLVEVVRDVEQEFSRQRILIIDDQPDAVRLLEQLLGEVGKYRVYVAANGQEGISMVARRRPDLVVLDLRMPDMDGFAVLHELRANPETSKIPVVVVTGDIDLNASEREKLKNIRILPKTDLNGDQYNHFLNEIKNELK